MEWIAIVVVIGLVFGLCFLIDKVFTKAFRSKAQHKSGKSVRLNKRYGAFGIILVALGAAAVFAGIKNGWILLAAGAVIVLFGAALVVYYMTCAIFYDEDAFIYTFFGKKSVTYAYKDIQAQQLYNTQGHIMVDLYMTDGTSVSVQSTMLGCFEFLDFAFAAWLRQTGKKEEDCPFHDPSNSIWFPPLED